MNILLTGSNGFIGSAIAARLHGHAQIWGLGRQQANCCEAIDHYVCADISNGVFLEELRNIHFDAIVHVAANISMDANKPEVLLDNCMGTYWITRLAKETGCKRLLYISSLPVVGTPHKVNGEKKPDISETDLPHPETVYHVSKLTGEYLVSLLRKEGIQAASLRIPSPIGVGMSPNTIFSVFLNKALENQDIVLRGAGTRRQNYLDVRDIAEAVFLALTATKLSECYNIVAAKTIANVDLAQRIICKLNSSSTILFEGEDASDDVDWKADGNRAQRELGFSQRYSLEDTIEWMMADKM